MREIRELTREEFRTAYRKVYKSAFPPTELRPMRNMERMTAAGEYKTVGLFEDGEALAYASLWRNGNYVLIDYLCAPAEKRNRGSGGEMIRKLREYYPPEDVLFGESEAPVGDPEKDPLILRRLEFYQRNGGVLMGYDIGLFGVHYKTIAFPAGPVDEKAVMEAHAAFYRKKLPGWLYRRAVSIPYVGGPLPEFVKWEEPEQ